MRDLVKKIAATGAIAALAACTHAEPQETAVGDYLSGRFAAREFNLDAAADAFSNAHSEVAGSPTILKDAFFFKLGAGDVDGAIPHAQELLALTRRLEAEAAARAEQAAASDGDADKDVDDDRDQTRERFEGDDGLASLALATEALRAGRYARAEMILSENAAAPYIKPAAVILRAWALAGQGKPQDGVDILRNSPDDVFRGFYPLHVALLADRAGLEDDARSAYQLAIQTYGGPVARSAYGAFLERIGDVEAARSYYELLMSSPGADREAARLGLERLDAGRKSSRYARVSPQEGSAVALYSIAAAISEQGANQRQQALEAGYNVGRFNLNLPLALTQLALYLDDDFDDALRFAGQIKNIYGDNESAIRLLSRIPERSPYWEQAQLDIASGLVALERSDEAVSILKKAGKRSGGAFEARYGLANLYVIRDDHENAVKTLDGLINDLPETPQSDAWRFHIARAAALMELDRWPEAETDLKRAVELAPEEATTLNYLGYSWAERGENLDEAFDLIEKAVALQPSSGAIIDSLGWAHYQRGNYDEAVGHLEQAAQLEPADPTITDHLGDVYWRLGRQVEARFQWERVLELEPDEEQRENVEEKLSSGLSALAEPDNEE